MKLFYFGCWKEPGHYLWSARKERLHYTTDEMPFEDRYFDGGLLLPRPERRLTGTLNMVNGWTIISWWGNPWDGRPGVNCVLWS